MTGPADPALSLAKAQRDLLGIDATIAYDTVREGDMHRRVRELGVPALESLSLCTKGGLMRALADRRRLRSLASEHDVIHAHASHDHGLATLSVAATLPTRVIRSIHHPRSTKKRAFQKIAYHRTDGFLLVAEAHRAALAAAYPGIDPARMVVVPGAVDPDRFSDQKSGAELRRKFEIPSDAFVVGIVARFQPGRLQPLLIEAVARARRQTTADLWLVLIGKGETQIEIERAIARHALAGTTRLYGFRDEDLPEAIRSCDVTVLLKEGSDASCRAVLQSMSAGVPVIGAKIDAVEDALSGADLGRIVPRNDVEVLTRAILELSSLPADQLREMGARARRRVLERYTERIRAERVSAFYRQMIALPRAR